MQKIFTLLLDDSKDNPSGFQGMLEEKGYSSARVHSQDEALAWIGENRCDIVVLNTVSCRENELFLQQLTERKISIPSIVISHQPSVNEAVSLLQAGASGYLESPVSFDQFKAAFKRTLLNAGGTKSRASRRRKTRINIIGESKKMKKVFSLVNKICDTDTTVLVHGESGTGKELIAQALHYEGCRRNGPFVPVNCGAIPGELLESELFGHEKGAFTHAIRTRVGRFELADSGTVFLDEISEMSPMLQVKLLRVLQERQFERVGGTKTIKSDFRVIAATNRDLEEEVKQGRFREDLYYRLNVIPVEVPPLRERFSDVPLLVNHFVKKFNRSKSKTIKGITDETLNPLLRYPWPGNVRELENVVERMVILALEDMITKEDLPERFLEVGTDEEGAMQIDEHMDEIPLQGFVLSEVVADFEKNIICQALGQTDWVKNRAAKLLNVNRTTLLEKMKRFNLVKPTAST